MSAGTHIPCHVISGALGVGKTTAIIDYLKRHREEFTAVLVNDFGPVGLDAAIMEGDVPVSPASYYMVPGGCICCTAASGFMSALQQLRNQPRVDRIIIEPSGMTMLGDMLDLLHSLRQEHNLEIRPVITLIDIKDLSRPAFTRSPFHVRLVEAADILVGNRCDLQPPEKTDEFRQWAQTLYPPKLRIVTTTHGRLPDEIFHLEPAANPTPELFFQSQHHPGDPNGSLLTAPAAAGHTGQSFAGGMIWEPSLEFSFEDLESALRRLATEGFNSIPLERLKALLRTDSGWKLLEIARGDVFIRPTDYRRDNRLDWITTACNIDAAAIASHLRKLARTAPVQ